MALPAHKTEREIRQAITILVVDDEPLTRISIAAHLESVGYRVLETGTADEAVSVLSSGSRIHLVFSDVELPGTMGGFSFAIWVRHHYRSIPVILTSGVSSVVPALDRQHLIPFIPKPYQPYEVSELIAKVLSGSPLVKGLES